MGPHGKHRVLALIPGIRKGFHGLGLISVDFFRFCSAFCGFGWNQVDLQGIARFPMVFADFRWNQVDLQGIAPFRIKTRRFACTPSVW